MKNNQTRNFEIKQPSNRVRSYNNYTLSPAIQQRNLIFSHYLICLAIVIPCHAL